VIDLESTPRLGFDEIVHVLREDLGFVDLEAYRRWIREVRPTIRPDAARIAKLSPDVVDCRAFWRACDQLFGRDPICNVAVAPEGGALPIPIESTMDANRMNLRLAKSFGMTALLEENAHQRLKTFEIGVGFGSLRSFIETQTLHVYVGVDVVPRVDGVLEATAAGTIPSDVLKAHEDSVSYVVSTNVFQHLSEAQRARHYADVGRLLHRGGLFLVNMTVDGPGRPPWTRDAQGRAWCDHYGQYTPIPTAAEVHGALRTAFDLLYVTQRWDGVASYVCKKR
jgi:hypothetical protein